MEGAYSAIEQERANQDGKWGGPKHDDHHDTLNWIAYIVKHTGKAVIWNASEEYVLRVFRIQMIRVGALAVAAIEWADRKLTKIAV